MLLLLAGCVSPEAIKPTTPDQARGLWQQHREKMSGISSWHLRGKIAVRTASKNGAKGGSATLVWTYQHDQQQIELYGPFGSGRVLISAQPGRAVLKDTKGKTLEGATAAEVLHQQLGWQVPFEQLRYWVRGLPGPDATDLTLDYAGRLKTLRQGIWRVEYEDYDAVNQLQLPRKLTITTAPGSMEIYARNGEYIGDQLSVKVLLKRWRDIEFAP